MRAIVYVRVSTDAQERDGTSLDTQERACLEFARKAGWHVVECIRDTASGFTLDRPGIPRLRQLLREGAGDVVLAYAVDRLSRNQNQIGVLFDEVQQAGACLDFVTEKFEDTAVGRFILAARAFIGEVEREKIVERTTRGKLERARSGRIPGATGKGCYGYVYDPRTGQRDIEPFQAEIVDRIFRRYAEVGSFSVIADELNQAGVPALCGGRWYHLTIRRMLMNESYAGRFIYQRTRAVNTRYGPGGRRRQESVQRPAEEWIEVDGASPRIVDEGLWQRVQQRLADPERTRQRRTTEFYILRSRARCGVANCGAALIGQAMRVRGRRYRYYHCRHAYDRRSSRPCPARYIRADKLEAGVWHELKRILTHPAVVLHELERQRLGDADPTEAARLERELAVVRDREKRLVRLYTYGEIDEGVVREEGAQLKRQRVVLEEQLRNHRPPPLSTLKHIDASALEAACAAVTSWLEKTGENERVLALEALQVAVVATNEAAMMTGVLPLDPASFSTEEPSSRSTTSATPATSTRSSSRSGSTS